jgi:hypothetical protein
MSLGSQTLRGIMGDVRGVEWKAGKVKEVVGRWVAFVGIVVWKGRCEAKGGLCESAGRGWVRLG